MAAHATTAPLIRSTRPRFVLSATRRATVRLLKSIHDVWDGSSWEPGRDWLTRVDQPGEPQTPR
jgi:hypothetical protein